MKSRCARRAIGFVGILHFAFFLLNSSVSRSFAQCGNVNSPYGINAHAPGGAQLTQLFDKVQAAGLGFVRIDFNWFAIETSQDVFNWSGYDAIAAAAEARGIRIFATLAYTPQWATSGAEQTGIPNNVADWSDFCFKAAQRYPTIQHWGMWNEANLDRFWAGTRQQYIDIILKPGADAVHAANPQAKVCAPEMAHLTSGDQDWYYWLRDSINQGADKIDIVTHHLYDSTNNADVTTKLNATTTFGTNPNNWTIVAPSVREVLVNTGWYGSPFWLTETGWESGDVGEANQANYYNGLLTDWLTGQSGRTWINKFFFYELQDGPTAPGSTTWGILRFDYTEKPSYTSYMNFITAHPPPPVAPCKATVPSPPGGGTNVGLSAMLSWTAGVGAASHNVYFGTTSPGTLRGNQAGTTFNPGALTAGTTYYWRIDEVNVTGTTTGDVWSFTTVPPSPPGKATNPSPANNATNINIQSSLAWTAGSQAASHNVYFGTTSPGTFRGNQSGASYSPAMIPFTTYFWRIDEVNAGGATTGDVWKFTTTGQRGDFDLDGDSDQSDFAIFQLCISGASATYPDGCGGGDFNGDGHIDATDVTAFVNCMTGPGNSPGC